MRSENPRGYVAAGPGAGPAISCPPSLLLYVGLEGWRQGLRRETGGGKGSAMSPRQQARLHQDSDDMMGGWAQTAGMEVGQSAAERGRCCHAQKGKSAPTSGPALSWMSHLHCGQPKMGGGGSAGAKWGAAAARWRPGAVCLMEGPQGHCSEHRLQLFLRSHD